MFVVDVQPDSDGDPPLSPGVYSMLRRLLRRHQLDDFERAEVRGLLDAEAAANSYYDADNYIDDNEMDSVKMMQRKRTDARRCFYHAVNCW